MESIAGAFDFKVYEMVRSLPIQARANMVINILWELAEAADWEFSEVCGDATIVSSVNAFTDREQFVRLCHQASMEINNSGLCDSGEWERWGGY